MAEVLAFYPYRMKPDGSNESICLQCFRTLRGSYANTLAERERDHLCDPSDLLHHEASDFHKRPLSIKV